MKKTRSDAAGGHALWLCCLLLLLLLVGCSDDTAVSGASAQRDNLPTVAVREIQPQQLATRRQWAGRLEPLRISAVQAARAGQVIELLVRDGDLVNQGQLLARIAAPDMEQRRDVLREQRAALDENLARWRSLAERDSAAIAEVMEAQLRTLGVSETLAQLEAELAYNVLRAPAAGRVIGLGVDVGSNVEEGQALMQVENYVSWGMRLLVPAREAAYFQQLEHLHLRDRQHQAWPIERIVVSAAAAQQLNQVDIYIAGQAAGRADELTVYYEASDSVLVVPWTAVASDDSGAWAVVIDAASNADIGQVQRRSVQLGRAHADGVEVLAGLSAGDRVLRFEPRAYPEGSQVRMRLVAP